MNKTPWAYFCQQHLHVLKATKTSGLVAFTANNEHFYTQNSHFLMAASWYSGKLMYIKEDSEVWETKARNRMETAQPILTQQPVTHSNGVCFSPKKWNSAS